MTSRPSETEPRSDDQGSLNDVTKLLGRGTAEVILLHGRGVGRRKEPSFPAKNRSLVKCRLPTEGICMRALSIKSRDLGSLPVSLTQTRRLEIHKSYRG